MRRYPAKLNPNTPIHDTMYEILYFIKYIASDFIVP